MADEAPKVVVVTGASAGVGRATALEFAREGAAVALLARGEEGLYATAREITKLGGKALVIPVDVADAGRIEQAADLIEKELGPIDVWVNNAMVTVMSTALETTPAEYRRVTDVTYLGTVYGTLAALKRMRTRNRGVIIQVGSALAYRAIALQSAYCAAKFAMRGFTDSLRVELLYEKSAVRLTMIQLAAFNTPQFDWARHHIDAHPQPVPPIYQPEMAARAIVWSATHKRRELYVGFPALKTIIGNKLFPGLADRLACKDAVDSQMDRTLPPPAPNRPDNLFEPVQGDFGAHGRFDQQASNYSWQLWISMHRGSLVLILALSMVAFAIALLVRG